MYIHLIEKYAQLPCHCIRFRGEPGGQNSGSINSKGAASSAYMKMPTVLSEFLKPNY